MTENAQQRRSYEGSLLSRAVLLLIASVVVLVVGVCAYTGPGTESVWGHVGDMSGPENGSSRKKAVSRGRRHPSAGPRGDHATDHSRTLSARLENIHRLSLTSHILLSLKHPPLTSNLSFAPPHIQHRSYHARSRPCPPTKRRRRRSCACFRQRRERSWLGWLGRG